LDSLNNFDGKDQRDGPWKPSLSTMTPSAFRARRTVEWLCPADLAAASAHEGDSERKMPRFASNRTILYVRVANWMLVEDGELLAMLNSSVRSIHGGRLRMRRVIVFFAVAFSIAPSGQTAEGKPEPLNCATGPLTKEIGGNTWLVYACADGKSLAVVSAPDSPASPSNFIVAAKGNAYAVSGEGNGQRNATKAAFEALAAMSSEAVSALYREVADAAAVNDRKAHPPHQLQDRPRRE
jgi:hypothetical protein